MHIFHRYEVIQAQKNDLYGERGDELPMKRRTALWEQCECGAIRFRYIDGYWKLSKGALVPDN